MGRRWDGGARAATIGAVAAAFVASACQLLGGIDAIEYSPDASAGADARASSEGGVGAPGPPCTTGDGGICVPSGTIVDNRVCSGGRLVNCGRVGDPCCPGGPTGFPDFCSDGKCESDGGYCVAAPSSCGVGEPCCNTFGLSAACSDGCCDWPAGKCVALGQTCTGGLCRQDLGQYSCGCGGGGQPCCPGDVCLEPNTSCNDGLCQPCGIMADMPCCARPGATPSCHPLAGLTCEPSGLCGRCGLLGKPCCVGSTCSEGVCDPKTARCSETASCGGCGGPGEKCCSGTCRVGECCDVTRDVCTKGGETCANGFKCNEDGLCKCGVEGHECCPGKPCEMAGSSPTVCAQGQCRRCGDQAAPCCDVGSACKGARPCDGGSCPLVCNAGTCQ